MRYCLLLLIGLAFACCNPEENPIDPKVDPTCDGVDSTPFVLDLPTYFGAPLVSTDFTVAQFELGRHLFYEKRLSRNNTTSCGSCHQQKLAFTDGLKKSVGLYGDTVRRSSMAISNMLWEDKFFWDFRAKSLKQQALMPIEDHLEMDLTLEEAEERLSADTMYQRLFCEAYGVTKASANLMADAIASFEKALISDNSKFDQYLRGETVLTPTEELGRKLFFTHPVPSSERGGNCGDCHLPQNTLGARGPSGMKNNGLDAESDFTDLGYEEVTNNPIDRAKFKTVSLRNIELTAPYMHDGRFETLEEVMDHYNTGLEWSPTIDPLMFASNGFDSTTLKLELLPFEIDAIIEFMKTLTDTTFINDQRFSDPFATK